MKTLILYATKYGAAAEIARRIAERMDGAPVHDLKQGSPPPLAEYDCIIIGGSVYAGMIRKEAKAFVLQNAALLKNKKFGLFLSGLDSSKKDEVFSGNFPPDILEAAKARAFLGGIFDPKKAGFFERAVMKAVSKQLGNMNTINDKKISQFVEEMSA